MIREWCMFAQRQGFFRYRTADPGAVHSDEVFAVARLAHKYHIQSVQDEDLRALQGHCLARDFDVLLKGGSL